MAAPERYVAEMNAFGAMLTVTPIESAIAALQLGVDEDGGAMFMVYLDPGRLVEGAAALVEWKRTLVRPFGVAERSADGDTVRIAVVGKCTENDANISVWVCHIPYRDLTCIEVEPDGQELFDTELLDLWAIGL